MRSVRLATYREEALLAYISSVIAHSCSKMPILADLVYIIWTRSSVNKQQIQYMHVQEIEQSWVCCIAQDKSCALNGTNLSIRQPPIEHLHLGIDIIPLLVLV